MELAEEEFLDQLFALISSEAFKSDSHESSELDGQGFFVSSADSHDSTYKPPGRFISRL